VRNEQADKADSKPHSCNSGEFRELTENVAASIHSERPVSVAAPRNHYRDSDRHDFGTQRIVEYGVCFYWVEAKEVEDADVNDDSNEAD
jgi:hypothetical protein